MSIGIVIALSNIEKSVDIDLIEEFFKTNKNIYICFVNNGSTDNTLDVLKLCEKKFAGRLSIVSIKNNKGNEAALKIGFRFLSNKLKFSSISFSTQFNFNELNSTAQFQRDILALN
ncbi:glycosyltransferase [Lutibacter citreus]|uniref:glycosyltransferase n=1 Tax=Lutibacter citreus TaxID=2138210 RepID=UPI000DBE66DA|nr:glycosyltransferase [Lutibacter citreus]